MIQKNILLNKLYLVDILYTLNYIVNILFYSQQLAASAMFLIK